MTTDTDALTERIKHALWDALPDGGMTDAEEQEAYRNAEQWLARFAAAVLPIVQAEVRKAKAEALREAERTLERGWPNRLGINLPPEDYDHAGDHAMETAQEYLKHRATEYETGAEHE